jgi:hypothetical protein
VTSVSCETQLTNFHSRTSVSRLLALRTGAHAFEDEPNANILAVLSDAFIFVIPGANTTPLLCLELFLDAQCQCSMNPSASPDLPDVQDEFANDVRVDIETEGRGYQLLKGVKNAMDKAVLIFPTEDKGEAYAASATQLLRALPPLLLRGKSSKRVEVPGHHKARGSRRLDLGMVEISADSEEDDNITSESDTDSIMNPPLYMDRHRSRSRQSARRTEARLKEAHRNMHSKPASFLPQGSHIHGDLEQYTAEPQAIDPRVLLLRDHSVPPDRSTQEAGVALAGLDARPETKVNFADHVEQASHDNPRPSTFDHRRKKNGELTQGNAHSLRLKKPGHSQPLAAHDQQPSLPPLDVNTSTRMPAKLQAKKTASVLDPESERRASKASAQPLLKRPQKSQTTSNNPMDWDVGEIADEGAAGASTKKQSLKKPVARQTKRKSQGQSEVEENSMQLDDDLGEPALKRPKTIPGKSQKGSSSKHGEFDIEVDDEEAIAPASKSTKATTKRATKAANKKTESQASKSSKVATAKQGAKGKTALRPPGPNVTSPAATRPRRKQPKFKKYVADSDTENEGEDNQVPAAKEDTIPRKEEPVKATKPAPGRVSKPLAPADAETELGDVIADCSIQNHTEPLDHAGPSEHAVNPVNETTKVSITNKTLVTASPPHIKQMQREDQDQASKDADIPTGRRKSHAHGTKADTDAAQDDLPETTEDSYPVAAPVIKGPRFSFGSKLGSFIQPAQAKSNTETAHTTPLSNPKWFIGAVNETRDASPKKKKPVPDATVSNTNADAAHRGRPAREASSERAKAADLEVTSTTDPLKKKPVESVRSHAEGKVKAFKGPRDMHTAAKQQAAPDPIETDMSDHFQHKDDGVFQSSAFTTNKRSSRGNAELVKRQQNLETTKSLPHNTKPTGKHQKVVEPASHGQPIDRTQDFDDDVSPPIPTRLKPVLREDPSAVDEEPTVVAEAHLAAPDAKESAARRTLEPFKSAARAVEVTTQAQKRTKHAQTPQAAKAQVARPKAQADTLVLPKIETLTTVEVGASKKPRIVQFGKRGPHNQGIPSPEQQTRKSVAASIPPSETQKQNAYKQLQPIAPVRHPFANAPKLGPVFPDRADEDTFRNHDTVFEDDEVLQDIGEPTQDEESASPALLHLSTEKIATSRSASQHSRVDQNGSPRLRPQNSTGSSRFLVSDLSISPDISDHGELRRRNTPTSADGSISSESASQESDPSFHLPQIAALPVQSDRITRTQTQTANTADASSPEKVDKQAARPKPIAMKAAKGARESLGLKEMTEEQYPSAEAKITTGIFKKPALKSAVAKPLEVFPEMLVSNEKPKRNGLDPQRRPLQEKSTHNKAQVQKVNSSPYRAKGVLSASPALVTKPRRARSLGQHNASTASASAPPQLRTSLPAKQFNKNAEKESTILENLNRGKSARRDAEDADRTLVEDETKRPTHCRQISADSFTESNSSLPETEQHTILLKDKKIWRKGSREAERTIHDTLMDITNVRLFPARKYTEANVYRMSYFVSNARKERSNSKSSHTCQGATTCCRLLLIGTQHDSTTTNGRWQRRALRPGPSWMQPSLAWTRERRRQRTPTTNDFCICSSRIRMCSQRRCSKCLRPRRKKQAVMRMRCDENEVKNVRELESSTRDMMSNCVICYMSVE